MNEARALASTVIKATKTFGKDMRERALSTFWQGFVSSMALTQPTTNWSELKQAGMAAAVAGMASVLSVAKSYAVRDFGIRNSASSNPTV